MSKIEWTQETWNPIIGCSKVSPGCDNCYAETMACRLAGMKRNKYWYNEVISNGKWNGKVTYDMDHMTTPLYWKNGRMIFVCSMGDLFHESVPYEIIDQVMAIIALTPQHTYQILTKRPERMAVYFKQGMCKLSDKWEEASDEMSIGSENDQSLGGVFIQNRIHGYYEKSVSGWPLTNLWIGVTAENQEQANKRLPYLNQIRAIVKFVSIEPMLEEIDLNKALGDTFKYHAGGLKNCLSWVIVGGESGHKARPLHPDWVIGIRNQCEMDNVPFFFKQWGEYIPYNQIINPEEIFGKGGSFKKCWNNTIKKSSLPFYKIGKKKAGNHLDGKQYLQMPKI